MVDFFWREKGGTPEKDSFFFLNLQSLRFHHDLMKVELDRLKNALALIALCETWLTDKDPTGLYSIDGYETIITNYMVGKKGGVFLALIQMVQRLFQKSLIMILNIL